MYMMQISEAKSLSQYLTNPFFRKYRQQQHHYRYSKISAIKVQFDINESDLEYKEVIQTSNTDTTRKLYQCINDVLHRHIPSVISFLTTSSSHSITYS